MRDEYPSALRCGVCIATHNRRDELARTLAQLRQLDPLPDEIHVCADGCTDGTEDLIRAEHPEVRLLVHESGRGSISSRNELARACTCEIFLSLDDDSHPLE